MTQASTTALERGAAEHAARLAAIDVGTNSIRLIIVDVSRAGTYRIIDDEKIITRLGRGSAVDGTLEDEAIIESVDAIDALVKIARGNSADRIRVIATAAVRDATNGRDMVDRVRERTGEEMDVIAATDEARLAHRSVAAGFDLAQTDAAIADIGGGSTEVVVSIQGMIEQIYTLPLGAVRLRERFGPCDDAAGDQLRAIRNYVRGVVRDEVDKPANAPQILIGTGGTFTTLAAMSMHEAATAGRADLLPGALRGHEIQRDEVRHFTEAIRRLPVDRRTSIPGLGSDRADIIVPGLVIIDRLMKRLGINRLRVHDRGIRDGVILEMIGDMGLSGAERTPDAAPIEPSGSAIEFAVRCGVDEASARHTAFLACSMYDQLGGLGILKPDPADRVLLEHAAILRDVGYVVNYSKHHKHSFHLILNADLAGMDAGDRRLVATIARYHRKAKPSLSHEEFAALSEADRERVRRLAALLRLADGMNRTHAGDVRGVSVSRESDTGAVVFDCESPDDPAVCIWGAQSRSELFEETFKAAARFQWADRPGPSPGETTKA
ncbi:MAG: Ppx/GppA phosphatase family protein [Planctomycetota bacterium]